MRKIRAHQQRKCYVANVWNREWGLNAIHALVQNVVKFIIDNCMRYIYIYMPVHSTQ